MALLIVYDRVRQYTSSYSVKNCSGVSRERPGLHPTGATYLERTVEKRRNDVGQLKKVITLQTATTKKGHHSSDKVLDNKIA